jgi:hypothetical protein
MLVQSSRTQPLASPATNLSPTPSVTNNVAAESLGEEKHPNQRPKTPAMRQKANKSSPIPPVTQGAGSALSINQQGGITAGTINVGPPPLLINKEQQDHLAASVEQFVSQFAGKKINISLHNATKETAEFGSALDAAFKKAGFQTNTGVVAFIGAVLSRGVTIRYGANRTQLAEAVRDSLLRDKVVDRVYGASGLDDDDFLIIVAP